MECQILYWVFICVCTLSLFVPGCTAPAQSPLPAAASLLPSLLPGAPRVLPQLPSHPQNAREDTWQWDEGIPAARFPSACSSLLLCHTGLQTVQWERRGGKECWQERLLRLTGEGLHPTCPPVLSLQLQEGQRRADEKLQLSLMDLHSSRAVFQR